MAKIKNILSLTNILQSNVADFLSIGIEIAYILKEEKSQLPYIVPEYIFVNKEARNYRVKIDKNQSADEIYENMYKSAESKKNIERKVDHRSQLFSLGVIFHQLLTNEFPIINANSLTINFSNNKIIPQTIQLIIEKLICHFPEDRYQSFDGLINDLKKCQLDIERSGEVSMFYPGEDDKPVDLQFENYLYGRDKELNRISELLSKYSSSKKSNPLLMFIHGPSGIGKTLLAKHATKQVQSKTKVVLNCKANQNEKTSFQTLQNLIKQIIDYALSNNCHMELRDKILETSWAFYPIIKNILPNLNLPPNNKKTKSINNISFANLLINYFQDLTKNIDLVIQVDDMQWLDETTLSSLLLSISFIQNKFTIITTTRASLYTNSDLLDQLFKDKNPPSEKLKSSFANIETHLFGLNGLCENEVKDQLIDLLSCKLIDSENLAHVLVSKTGGNPLYMQQLLVSFKDKNLLWFDHQEKEWVWRLSEIEKEAVTENIADLLVKKIKNLPINTQKSLHYASIIGSEFSANIIADALDLDLITVELTLWHATEKKIIVAKETDGNKVIYKFLHDKIQQACTNDKTFNSLKSHYNIGKAFLNKYGKDTNTEHLSKITFHLNKCSGLLNKLEINDLVLLNKLYGDKLINNLSDSSAETHYSIAIELYHKYAVNNKTLLEKLYFSKVTACQMSGQIQEALHTLERIKREIPSPENEEKTLLKKLNILTTDSQYEAVVNIGMNIIEAETKQLIPSNLKTFMLLGITTLKLNSQKNKIKHMKPKMNKLEKFHSEIIFNLCDSAYFFNKKTYVNIICLNIQLMLKKGISDDTPFILIQFANLLLVKFDRFKLATNLSLISLELIGKNRENNYKYQTEFIYSIFISRWVNSKEVVIDQLKKSIDNCKNNNLLTFALYSITQSIFTIIGSGEKLSNVERFIYKHNPYVYSVGFYDTVITLEISKCYINSLKNGSTTYKTSIFDDVKSVQKMESKGLTAPYGWYLSSKLKTHYFLEDLPTALSYAYKTKENLDCILGLNEVEEYYLYHALTILELKIKSNEKLTKNEKKDVKKSLKLYQLWAKRNPANFTEKYFLIKGTYNEYKKNILKAIENYKKCIEITKINNQLTVHSIALEKLAKCYSRSDEKRANQYYLDSLESFKEWGATAKSEKISNLILKNKN